MHIEKTAGQSLRDHMITHMKLHYEFIHYGYYGERLAREKGLGSFAERSLRQRNDAEVVLGHFVDCETHKLIPAKKARYITFLREPSERMVSLYNFTMHRLYGNANLPSIGFDEWWAIGKKQTQVNWMVENFLKQDASQMTGEQVVVLARQALEKFWFVGTVETFKSDAGYLMKKFGLPELDDANRSNVTGLHFKRILNLTPALREMLTAELEADYTLYNEFSKRLRTEM